MEAEGFPLEMAGTVVVVCQLWFFSLPQFESLFCPPSCLIAVFEWVFPASFSETLYIVLPASGPEVGFGFH